jgi:hypothetical protein
VKQIAGLVILFWSFTFSVYAQQDSVAAKADNDTLSQHDEDLSSGEEDEEHGVKLFNAPLDSAAVTARSFDDGRIQELKDDPALQYKDPGTVGESLWDRVISFLKQLFASIFRNAVSTNWGRAITLLVGFGLVIVIILTILRVNAFRIFYSGEGASTIRYGALDENIHEMDFEKLIREAAARNDHRVAVRLIFLYALKILSDKGLVHWEQGKTNHDYLTELKDAELHEGFHALNYYFEYAWYGNFNINAAMFSTVEKTFSNWKSKLA